MRTKINQRGWCADAAKKLEQDLYSPILLLLEMVVMILAPQKEKS